MHNYLHNGDILWPKSANLCALGRNAFVDLALGAGTSLEMGLWGSAWESQIRSVAFTNSLKHGSFSGGTSWFYVWPVISTSHIYHVRQLIAFLNKKSRHLPDELKIPSAMRWQAKYSWEKNALADVEKTWAEKMLLAYILRFSIFLKETREKSRKEFLPDRIFFIYEKYTPEKRNNFVKNFVDFVKKTAEKKDLLFPSLFFRQELENLTFTSVKGYKKKLSQAELKALSSSSPDIEEKFRKRLETLEYITTGKFTLKPDETLKKLRERYVSMKKLGVEWNLKLKTLASSPEISEKVHKALLRSTISSTGNFFHATTHLEESSSGYTHAGFVVRLPAYNKPILFERVLGFYYVNPAVGLKNSSVVEVLNIPENKDEKIYSIIPFKVNPPFRFKRGISDVITMKNVYYSFKKTLSRNFRLGPGFLYGTMHLLPHLRQNRILFRDAWGIKKLGKYSYLDLTKAGLFKGKEIHLIARCIK